MDKCQTILFTPKNHIPISKLTVSNRELGWAPGIIYLGLTLVRTLTFRKHIRNISSKAIRKINLLIYHTKVQDSSLYQFNNTRNDLRLPSLVHPIQNPSKYTPKTQNYALRLITRSQGTHALPSYVATPTSSQQKNTPPEHRPNFSFYLKPKNDPNINPTLVPSLTTRMLQTRKSAERRLNAKGTKPQGVRRDKDIERIGKSKLPRNAS